ncbi:MAG: ATP-binding protein, partial [Pseudomonadota bacterium]
VYQDQDNNIWAGYDGGKIQYINEANGTVNHIEFIEKNAFFYEMTETSDKWWFATSVGLYFAEKHSTPTNISSLKFQKIFPSIDNVSENNTSITALKKSPDGKLWFGTNNQGLFHLNTDSYKISSKTFLIENEHGILNTDFIFHLYFDDSDRLWIATNFGLHRIDSVMSETAIFFKVDTGKNNGICHRVVNKIINTQTQEIWLATNDGLAKFDESTQSFQCFDQTTGYPSSHIKSIFEDKNNQGIWVAGHHFLALTEQGSELKSLIHQQEGLYGSIIVSIGTIDEKNILWLGTRKGLNRVNLNGLLSKQSEDNIVIADVLVNNIRIPFYETTGKILHLNLEHSENALQIDYANLDYTRIMPYDYHVQLTHWDNNWIKMGQDQRIRYSNLSSGHYLFKIALDKSHQSQPYTGLTIEIMPSFWQSPFLLILYVLAALLLIYQLIKLRTRHLENKAKSLEQVIAVRMRETLEQKQTIEILLKKNLELFANISHEFRTPLTLILGPANKLLRLIKQPENKKDLHNIVSNASRLLKLVNQLLDISKLNSMSPPKALPFDVSGYLPIMINQYASLLEERQLNINNTIEPELFILIDQENFEKIITNLLTNAINFSEPHKTIHVSAKSTNSQVQIRISDQGRGIAPENHEKIFERFTRIEDSQGQQVPGTGIGLALVKQLVNSNQGSISLKSQLHKGSTFTVSFKQIDITQLNQQYKPSSFTAENYNSDTIQQEILTLKSQPTNNIDINALISNNDENSKKPFILVVEDNSEMREYIYEGLNPYYHLRFANDGVEGTAMAVEFVPDLIISDLMMPKKDGFEFSKIVRNDSRTSHIPIIILTAKADIETRKVAWRLYVDEYIAKPFNIEELILRCQNLLYIRTLLGESLRNGKELKNTNRFATLTLKDQKFLTNLEACVAKNYSSNDLNVAFLCQHLAMSESQLQRKLKALMGQSVPDFIKKHRLHQAAEQIKQGKRISDIAFDVGFSSQSYFSRCFKEQFGMTPKQYQDTNRQQTTPII